jgi:hypothetical protein
MKTGNRRRRKLNRLAKARALRRVCALYQKVVEAERKADRMAEIAAFAQRLTRFVEDASKAA